jgi:ornithine decarboxylase
MSTRLAALEGEIPMNRFDRYFAERRPATPCVVINLDTVRARYSALRQALPAADIYYAVKANPAKEIVAALAELGANLDLASPGEIDICLGLHIPAGRLSFGNTIKREMALPKRRKTASASSHSTVPPNSKSWRARHPVRGFSADC